MTIKTERLKESIHIIATEEVIPFVREFGDNYGIITVLDIRLSPDKNYADIIVHGQDDDRALTNFLSPLAHTIHGRIARELGLRKTPKIRFRISKERPEKKDILTTIRELDEQYGLSE